MAYYIKQQLKIITYRNYYIFKMLDFTLCPRRYQSDMTEECEKL